MQRENRSCVLIINQLQLCFKKYRCKAKAWISAHFKYLHRPSAAEHKWRDVIVIKEALFMWFVCILKKRNTDRFKRRATHKTNHNYYNRVKLAGCRWTLKVSNYWKFSIIFQARCHTHIWTDPQSQNKENKSHIKWLIYCRSTRKLLNPNVIRMLLSFSCNTEMSVVSLSWDCWSLCCISSGCSIDQSEHQSHWHFWPVRWLELEGLLWPDRILIRPKASTWVATGLFTIVPWDESVQVLTRCNLLPPSVQQRQGATLFQRKLCCVCYMILVVCLLFWLLLKDTVSKNNLSV